MKKKAKNGHFTTPVPVDPLLSLNEFVEYGLVERAKGVINVTDLGRGFISHICKVFDSFLRACLKINN